MRSLSLPQLEDGHSLFEYDVGLNGIIQLLIQNPAVADPGIGRGRRHR